MSQLEVLIDMKMYPKGDNIYFAEPTHCHTDGTDIIVTPELTDNVKYCASYIYHQIHLKDFGKVYINKNISFFYQNFIKNKQSYSKYLKQ